ncbi:acetolactate synthase small subunit [Arthrobacter sedimenti]|uniref:amino acid-binding protein n=1 Tax=Arthrobacter sedimenti TaxID=2694931 RepID=UPI000B35C7AB|nr:amino acid-binding protein [Arthrobacter sedimenti]OUM41819.1 amino acid-binding protein [Arthrobacter agilis]
MTRSTGSTAASLRCDSCGQLPEPGKVRLTLANVAVMLPIELAVHAAVVQTHLAYPLKVLLLALTATALVIWVAEPSVMRFLRAWLHAPALRQRKRLDTAMDLWRARVLVEDTPGALERISHQLARRGVNILSLHIHPGTRTSVDEFVLAAPAGVGEQDLSRALTIGGGTSVRVWPSTALALADGQTKALALACRVVQDPLELRYAVAELLVADPVVAPSPAVRSFIEGAEFLKIPSPVGEPLVFSRTGEPFTAAESARAHRLAELAALATHSARRP